MNADGHGEAPASKGLSDSDEALIEAIILGCDLAGSYARSAAESAWRGEIDVLESDLRRLRDQVVAVITNFKKLEALRAKPNKDARHAL
jgi:hypothetical protein